MSALQDYNQIQRQKLLEQILRDAPREAVFAGVDRFLKRYFSDVPPEDMVDRDVDSLRAMAIGHAEFAQKRLPGRPLIRIFNPTIATHGWQSTHTIVEVVTDDMPFLVDSVGIALNRRGLTIHLTVHPLIRLLRDDEGNLLEFVDAGREGARAESFLHIEIDCETSEKQLQKIREDLEKVLHDVACAVEDWKPMLDRVPRVQQELASPPASLDADEVNEASEFLDWLADNHFTLLGYREYDLRTDDSGVDVLKIVPSSGLGILRERDDQEVSQSFRELPAELQRLAREPNILTLTKGVARSTVHRPSYLDYVGVKRFDDEGNVVGEFRFMGLYTSNVYACDPYEIPVVRRKLQYVTDRSGLQRNSHADKTLQTILRNYPRDELIQIPAELLYQHAIGILHLQERQRLRLFTRLDPYRRFVSCLIFVPRERYDTRLRKRFEDILMSAFNGKRVEFNIHLGESLLARVHLLIHTDPRVDSDVDLKALEFELAEAAHSWREKLGSALKKQYGEETGNELLKRYHEAFPVGYRDEFSAALAVRDILALEKLRKGRELEMDLYRIPGDAPHTLRLRVYQPHDPIPLSDILPMLENMGLRVIAERPYKLHLADGESWIHDFRMAMRSETQTNPQEVVERFSDAFVGVYQGEVENDGFNRLVLEADLDWRQAMTLRALCRYLMQLRMPFSQAYVESTLSRNSAITKALVEYFEARFDPYRTRGEDELEELKAGITAQINEVSSLDEDRILSLYLAVIDATLRTNYYQKDDEGRLPSYLVMKLSPEGISIAPKPRPKFEIYVYAPWVEGVHLRGGKVARGGLRWSDRREDFRTEVLGLMKAQMVKNAVIVPVGAKGGFVVKQPPSSPDALKEEVVRCYSTFIQGLLDLTDNRVDGEIVPPKNTVRYDDDDPYLVVAADKGTATFSDLANSIADRNNFWLGDAFASGGSEGYDHKGMGITARGAWESVKRHFRELGRDCQAEPFTVTGIGDMGGDVFGNGMLLSRQIKLVAAFNHLHIFIDPDPDPETSFQERERLFKLPRSGWNDYDSALISEGGGVYERSAKSITLSDRACEALGISTSVLTPNELMAAILRAPVDLLWNGGIGTFVKSSDESHADVGDRANDAIRADGEELRCRIVGEGGNLGLTQLGRIEYSRNGGRVNTDSIDNSGGVDCSDHEVNIKTLLGQVIADGEMDMDERNALLREMTDEVAELVLTNNYRQAMAISISNYQRRERFDSYVRLMRAMERRGILDRALEDLPDNDVIKERQNEGEGLCRPELAILLSYVKIDVYQRLLASEAPEDPWLSTDLHRYFPRALTERYDAAMEHHPLRREIIATHLTNSLVNSAGYTLVQRYCDELGYSIDNLVRAYAAARDIFDIPSYRRDIESLDNVVANEVQIELLLEGGRLIERAAAWLLQNAKMPLDISSTVERFRSGIETIRGNLFDLVVEPHREGLEAKAAQLEKQDVPAAMAKTSASLGALLSGLDIIEAASSCDKDLEQIAALYFKLGDQFEVYWLREQLSKLEVERHWQRRAHDGLYWDLYRYQHLLTLDIAASVGDGIDDIDTAISKWVEENRERHERLRTVLSELRDTDRPDFSMITVGARELKALVDHVSKPS
ncbi:MAG: NAD-glutamate dehydrogenase [Gammaproteobacteria bacterium]|nr:NAD-glutamate dehydrogenase [Gammaproteobacteria bacterium]